MFIHRASCAHKFNLMHAPAWDHMRTQARTYANTHACLITLIAELQKGIQARTQLTSQFNENESVLEVCTHVLSLSSQKFAKEQVCFMIFRFLAYSPS